MTAPAPALPRTALADSPVIITVAPNGAYKKTADHPAVPLTADALAVEARACLDAGAAMMHMHVRKPDGSHLLDAQAYRDALAAVQRAVGDELLVQVTSEAAGVYQAAEQIAMVRELQPEAVSIGLREIAVPGIPEAELAAFLAWLADRRVMTQIILYDDADVRRWLSLRARSGAAGRMVGAVRAGPLQRGTDVVGLRPAAVPGRVRPFAALGDLRLRPRGKRLRHDRGGLWGAHACGIRKQSEAARRIGGAGQCGAGRTGRARRAGAGSASGDGGGRAAHLRRDRITRRRLIRCGLIRNGLIGGRRIRRLPSPAAGPPAAAPPTPPPPYFAGLRH